MSLRARLLLGMAVVAVVLVLASASINRATEHKLVSQVDQQLERATQQVRQGRGPWPYGYGGAPGNGNNGNNGNNDSDDGDGDGDSQPSGPGTPSSSIYLATIDDQTGQLQTLSYPNTVDDDTPPIPDVGAAGVTARLDGPAFTVGSHDSELRYRAIVRRVGPTQRTVLIAQPLEDVDEAISRLVAIQGIAAGVILVVLGLVTFWVLRLGVRPVKQMTDVAKAIGEGDLSQRIPDTAPGTEAGELGDALNTMLGRIEQAFDDRTRSEARLRQFVGDASHELRTPVTTIRGYAELYRLGGLSDEHALDEAMRRTEQEATRMGQLVSDLLDLARLDQGRPLNLGPVDLAVLANDAAADSRAVEPGRPIDVVAPAPTTVLGDEPHLRQIVSNLVGNARVHTDAGTPIRITVRDEGAAAVLEVTDQGPGMAPEVAAHAFERFYRADPARTRHRGGSGLGLSIVASSVAAHGGTVGLQSAPGQGTTVRVTLPKSPSSPTGAPVPPA